MSALSDFFTQPFWPGVPLGAIAGGALGALINAKTSKASDLRKAEQEDRTNREKRNHEEKLEKAKRDHEAKVEREKREYEAATEYARVCNEIITGSLDIKGVFNFLSDAYHNASGLPDPKAMEKIAFAETQMEEFKKIAGPFQRLQMVASPKLMTSAIQLSAAMAMIQRTITEPLARPVAVQAASGQLLHFINTFREETGRGEYSPSEAQLDALSFMATLKQQVDAFIDEAKRDMREAGFTTTPWDV